MTSVGEYDAVVFDLDGVLVDSIAVMERAFCLAFAECGGRGAPPFTEFVRRSGGHLPAILAAMSLPAGMVEPFVRESRRLISEIHPFTGIFSVLDELSRRGVRLAVATGKTNSRASEVLRHTGLAAYFSVVVGSDDVATPKPAPDMVLRALADLAVEPADALFVGDSVADLRCGAAAGTDVAAALWGHGDPDALRAERPDHVVDLPTGLLALRAPARA